ncbi:MAG TPA: DUF2508 family protein [Symbiobacteriaceae bacterium]|jgi:histidyl-tRNA synthetase
MLNREGSSETAGTHIARQDLMSQVQAAHREWQAAQNYFQEVSEPNLVDVAIFSMEAAQRKYMHLVRQLRNNQGEPLDQEG